MPPLSPACTVPEVSGAVAPLLTKRYPKREGKRAEPACGWRGKGEAWVPDFHNILWQEVKKTQPFVVFT